jgi:L-histidine Nalpha-methyltransferase
MLQPRIIESGDEFARDVARGLETRPRVLSPKYFYDEIGSALFEDITRQPEYYLTRTEASLLRRWAPSISELVGSDVSLVELGSGSSVKTTILLESLLERYRRLRYLPIDISETILQETASELDRRYPALEVMPIASQYEAGLSRASVLVAEEDGARSGSMLVLFLGSSIGNMEPEESVDFLARLRRQLGFGDRLLVGFDLVKDEAILDAAYNDAAGVTARFNLNLLDRINRELGGEFDLDRFSHQALFNRERSRVEMHLRSSVEQEVLVKTLGRSFSFESGETIHTENSYKYTPTGIEELASAAGLAVAEIFTDEKRWFALTLLGPA